MWFKHRQKALKFQKQHALKGQKLQAQGNALGIIVASKAPCKGKSFKELGEIYKAFALTGRQVCVHNNPGRCPGLGASALSGRVEPSCTAHGAILRKFSSSEKGKGPTSRPALHILSKIQIGMT